MHTADSPSHAPVLTDLFVSGEGGYHTYRIPAVVATPRDTLLAFCEGRRHSTSDAGDIDLLLRRSTDGGRTWEPPRVLWDDGPNTCGNPCAVVDHHRSAVWLFVIHGLGRDTEKQLVLGGAQGRKTVWLTSSRDDGQTWAPWRDLTEQVADPAMRWYVTGPGAGIQTRHGRLVIPCDHKLPGGSRQKDPATHFSHVIFSDDGGGSWRRGGPAGPGANECEVVELADSTLMLNMRSYRGEGCRLVALSRDGGESWSDAVPDRTLIEPICQASIRRLTGGAGGAPGRSRILFSNPASTGRDHLTVRLSYDEGRSWPAAKLLCPGPAAYSCLITLPDGAIGCFYERGQTSPYQRLTLARFGLAWLTDGQDAQ